MHVARQPSDHARIRRGGAKNFLQERDPSLINLPIPLPSIPILSPLLDPLIGGNNRPSSTAAAAPTPNTPAPAPVPSPTTTPSTGNSGNGSGSENGGSGDGNGNGNGNGGNNGDGSSGGDSGGSGGDSGGSGGDSGGSGGDSGGSGGDSGESSGDSDGSGGNSGGSDGGSSNSGSDSGAGSDGSGSGSGNPSNTDSSAPETTSGSGNSDGSGGSESLDNSSSGGSNSSNNISSDNNGDSQNDNDGPVANAVGGSTAGGSGVKTALATGTRGGVPNPSGSSDPNSPDGLGGSGSGGTKSGGGGGISTGAIAAIAVVVALIVLGIIVFLLRKRSISRRSERRNRWWGRSVGNNSTGYVDRNSAQDSQGSRASVASSFATTFDHGRTSHLNVEVDIPPMPPMAELRNDGTATLMHNQSPVNESPVLISFDNSHLPVAYRTSINSIQSNTSDRYSQYLVVANSNLDSPEGRTPMSVRPFSPSESFAFPQPPTPRHQSGDWSSSRPASSITLTNSTRSSGQTIPPVPDIPANPFADPMSPHVADLAEVETIKRPYIPSRPDELRVSIADSVKVLQLFDDGWAVVEKIPSFDEILSKADQTKPTRGLIPIDCFRGAAQDLTSFFTERRVSIPYAESTYGVSVTAL
ncbi:hypothetical protein Hypma_016528 [Hypsizygus marmoreus]|uniref:SH3 domain-containing protein n=1 Tax=Hypsizygus marmoreus TaxID=39966 RepID=A0A369J500_HYPMA|nr:hypothetical protein Hypma_016528 [Hypsizygus marmoreus]